MKEISVFDFGNIGKPAAEVINNSTFPPAKLVQTLEFTSKIA